MGVIKARYVAAVCVAVGGAWSASPAVAHTEPRRQTRIVVTVTKAGRRLESAVVRITQNKKTVATAKTGHYTREFKPGLYSVAAFDQKRLCGRHAARLRSGRVLRFTLSCP
jgi:hypothetical protein